MCFLISVQQYIVVRMVLFLIILILSTISFTSSKVKELSRQSILLLIFFPGNRYNENICPDGTWWNLSTLFTPASYRSIQVNCDIVSEHMQVLVFISICGKDEFEGHIPLITPQLL